jgi:hypothetical protein
MTGYLQRLLDPALPASGPHALRPVVKSTSPIFEQNQLLGLAGFHPGEGHEEVARPVADVPSSRTPLPPAAATAVPTLELTRHDLQPAMPAPPTRAEVRGYMAGDPSATRSAAADATAPLPQEPPDFVVEPGRPDPERFETTLVVEPEGAADGTAMLAPREAVFAPAEIEGMATEAPPAIGPEAIPQPNTESRPAASQIATRDGPRAVNSIEQVPDAPLPPSVLEPRPRPDFDDDGADPPQPQPEPLQAPPRITIDRVTVELVPDHAPVPRSAGAPRTAEAASMIGPLGNRRTRRRLFALTRL